MKFSVKCRGFFINLQPNQFMQMENTISKEKRWKILKSEYISRRPWMTARRDTVEYPDGRVNDEYWVLEYPEWVNVIAITKEGKMVMERQYRHGAGITSYELPCGVVEAGEDPLDAARRELEEETGYTGGEWTKLMVTSANPGSMNNWAHSYLAVGVEKTTSQHLDSTEELEVHLLDQDYVKALLLDNQILQALMVGPLYKYFYEIKG